MKNNIVLYVAGSLFSILLLVYVIYLLNSLLQNLSVISGSNIGKAQEIPTFNLEKFGEIKKAQ
ncbi:MAG: hypothetical protein Q8L24_02650 [bacterium]|nr:hypothetical protein [bacterium]